MVEGEAAQMWRVGPGYIELKDVVLLGLRQVSKSGLQPVLAYRRATLPT